MAASKSDPDRMGWDFVLEVEPEVVRGRPLDQQHVQRKALVQVKSSDTRLASVRAKLSAMKRLVDADLPVLVAVLEYGQGGVPWRARLLEVGEAEIEQVLREVRVCEARGIRANNRFISIPLGRARAIAVDGSDLLNVLRDMLPADGAAYAVRKKHVRDTCGYDENSVSGEFSIAGPDGYAAMVDLLIGRAERIAVDRVTIRKTRFDVALPSDVVRIERAWMEVGDRPSLDLRIEVVDENGDAHATQPKQAVFPPVPNLPERLRRVRVHNAFVDAEMGAGDHVDFTFKLREDAVFDVHEIAGMLDFMFQLGIPGRHLRLSFPKGDMDLLPDGRMAVFQGMRSLRDFATCVSGAVFKSRGEVTLRTSLSELRRHHDAGLRMFSFASMAGIGIGFEFEGLVPLRTQGRRGATVFYPILVDLGDLQYGAVVEASIRIAKATRVGWHRAETLRPRTVEDFVRPRRGDAVEMINRRCSFHVRQNDPAILTFSLILRRSDGGDDDSDLLDARADA